MAHLCLRLANRMAMNLPSNCTGVCAWEKLDGSFHKKNLPFIASLISVCRLLPSPIAFIEGTRTDFVQRPAAAKT